MLRDEVDATDASSAADLLDAYRTALRSVVEEVGVDGVVAETGVSSETVRALADGDVPAVTLAEAAAILALSSRADAETIEQEARDVLLMGMSVAVVDVDVVASKLGGDLEPKEIQAKVEGRQPMTLEEYARVQHTVEDAK